jgi:hypothetical protein
MADCLRDIASEYEHSFPTQAEQLLKLADMLSDRSKITVLQESLGNFRRTLRAKPSLIRTHIEDLQRDPDTSTAFLAAARALAAPAHEPDTLGLEILQVLSFKIGTPEFENAIERAQRMWEEKTGAAPASETRKRPPMRTARALRAPKR